ncbi:MAG: hypothetical protein BV457_01635 [Thermoplasmata archaeon M9B1D]|nr:MAG: hypothetical protein BV457_01635 [Thermoplasmata archaeon M9B1D]
MEIKINENDTGSNKVATRQNSSGFWYCDKLEINCISIIDGVALMKTAIEEMKKVLNELNKDTKK